MGCDNNYNSCNPCGNNSINTGIPESIIRLLRYLKDPVLYINNLYGNFPDGGELGWLAYVVSENKFATWDVEKKKWKYINDSYLKSSELKTIDDNAIVGEGNISIYTDIPNIPNISIDSFNLHLSKNTTSGIFETDKDSIAVIESNNSKEFETTTEHSIFYKNTGDDILLLTYPKEDRYVYFNDSDNIINVQPNQIVKVLIKGIGLKRIIQSFHQSKASYIRKPVFDFTSSTTFSTDYKSQDVSIPFKSNAKILGVLLSNNIGLKATVKSIIINNNDYSKGEIIPFDLRKGNNTYNGVLKINIPANNSLDSSEYSVTVDAMIDTEKESKSCSVAQGVAPVIFKTDTTVIRFKASGDLSKLINITSSIGSLFTDFEIQSYPDWTSINKETVTNTTQKISIEIEENEYTEEKSGSIKLYQPISKKNIEVNIIQEKAEIPSLPEYIKGEEKNMYLETIAQYQAYGCNWDAATLSFGTGNPNLGTYPYIRIGEYEWMTRRLRINPVEGRIWDKWRNTQALIDAYVKMGNYDAMTLDQSLQYEGAFLGSSMGANEVDALFTNTTFYTDNTKTQKLTGWTQPSVADFAQLFAMADTLDYNGIVAFHGVEKDNPKYPFKNDWQTIAKNKSGFSMIPCGSRNNITGIYTNPRRSCAFKTNVDNGSIIRVEVPLSMPASIIVDNNDNINSIYPETSMKFHLVSVVYCRPLTNEELGYKMYIDRANDRIIVVTLNSPQPTNLTELEKGKLRGRAVRWLNAGKTKVIAPLSHIEKELEATQNGGGAGWFGF